MKPVKFSEEVCVFSNGIGYTVDAEYLGLITGKRYYDALNIRLRQKSGVNSGVPVAINGEQLKYPLIVPYHLGGGGFTSECIANAFLPAQLSYKCILATMVQGHLFEIWADKDRILPTFFRADGHVVAGGNGNHTIPFSVDYPIQYSTNNTPLGGEIFLTDNHVVPQIYVISDMLINSGIDLASGIRTGACTDKYFASYNYTDYSINTATQADHPVFIELATAQPAGSIILGTSGLFPGTYQYSIQYVDSQGNTTDWSEPTPNIPVIANIDSANSNTFPYLQMVGAAPQPLATEGIGIGIHIRFRVTNINNYSSMNIRRVAYNSGSPIGTQGTETIVYQFNITAGQIGIVDIFDFGATGTSLTVSAQRTTQAVIETAKGIRYYDRTLYLANINYASRDVSGVTFLTSPDTAWPVMKNIGTIGHHDPYNSVYYKHFMNRERYGFGVKYIDGFNTQSFVGAFPGAGNPTNYGGAFNNYMMPNRRDTATSINNYSQDGTTVTVTASDVTNTPNPTFEIFDMSNAASKNDTITYKNIFATASSFNVKPTSQITMYNANIGAGAVSGSNVVAPYYPFTPKNENDPDVSGHNFVVNTAVYTGIDSFGNPLSKISLLSTPAYQPKGFAQQYLTMGMSMAGLANIPSWVSAFSIQVTPPAGRVVTQGIAFYSLNENPTTPGASGATKDTDKIVFYSPDAETGLTLMQDIIDNPSIYSVEFICPLGSFSEVYSFRIAQDGINFSVPTSYAGYNVDMVNYARVYYDNSLINTDGLTQIGNGDGYVNFGRFRNVASAGGSVANIFNNSNPGNAQVGVTGATAVTTKSGRQTFYKIQLDAPLYSTGSPGSNIDAAYGTTNLKRFTEPFYIVNIVRKDAVVDTSVNQTQYVSTGHYQKISSIIGQSNGAAKQSFLLVDENPGDCIVKNGTDIKYIWIEDINGNQLPWVNISMAGTGSFTLANIFGDIANGTNNSGANPTNILAGVYSQSITQVNGLDRFYTIIFESIPGQNQAYCIPTGGYNILVNYDNRFPVTCFGDNINGDAVWAPIDGSVGNGGDAEQLSPVASDHPGNFNLDIGFPYFHYECNPRLYIPNYLGGGSIPSGAPWIQQLNSTALHLIRQMLNVFTCSSKTHVPYCFNELQVTANYGNQYFPLMNYVMRSSNWDASVTDVSTTQLAGGYYSTDYLDEFSAGTSPHFKIQNWIYGGFRFKQSTLNWNIDYSEGEVNFPSFGRPVVGYNPQTFFPTRSVWSVQRQINDINDPSLRTFPALNYRDIDDNTGEIKLLYSAQSAGRGDNLYAFTEHGICLLMTDKYVVRQGAGTDWTVVQGSGDEAVMLEEWLHRDIGLGDEMWRSFAEHDNVAWFANKQSIYKFENEKAHDIAMPYFHWRYQQDILDNMRPGFLSDLTGFYDIYHGEYWLSYKDRTFTCYGTGTYEIQSPVNYNGLYYQIDGELGAVLLPTPQYAIEQLFIYNNTNSPVQVQFFSGTIYPTLCFIAPQMYRSFNIYGYGSNLTNPFLWECSPDDIAWSDSLLNPIVLVWQDEPDTEERGKWVSRFTYEFDKFASDNNNSYGFRNVISGQGGAWQLDRGNQINGANVAAEITGFCTGDNHIRIQYGAEAEQPYSKEFHKLRINGNVKPTRIEFFQHSDQVDNDAPVCFLDISTDSLYLKDYYGFEALIPRKSASPNDRLQGRMLYYKIKYNGGSPLFRVTDSVVSFHKIK
jgi:hypothetical protein